MISDSPSCRVMFLFVFRDAGCCTPMMAVDRSTRPFRAILFLIVSFGLPSMAATATLEDSAKELARKIAAALPAQENVSCEIRNISSLRPDEVSRIEQALKTELGNRSIHLIDSGGAATSVIVTLSENWKELVWTGEIRQGGISHAVLLPISRAGENHSVSNAMHVTIRSEKFWEGSRHILDATEASNGIGKSWLVLLLPDGLEIQDLQTGSTGQLDIAPAQSNSRDPWGQLGSVGTGDMMWFATVTRVCPVNLVTLSLSECLPAGGSMEVTPPGPSPMLIDLAPAGPRPRGKGIELVIAPVCGGMNQFLATSWRDYTQTDSLQVFQMEQDAAVAMSGELDFPGPIIALHTAQDAPRAIVRNLSTGNYEAYRLAISCGE